MVHLSKTKNKGTVGGANSGYATALSTRERWKKCVCAQAVFLPLLLMHHTQRACMHLHCGGGHATAVYYIILALLPNKCIVGSNHVVEHFVLILHTC